VHHHSIKMGRKSVGQAIDPNDPNE